MRVFALLRALVFVSAVAAPHLIFAQFQQPTDEELKMTADPKAPGADAVYLNFEETTNDPLHFHSVYARIKVLTEKGKELATISLPYLRGDIQVTDIKGRTIHPDGTVIPLTGKPEDLLAAKSGDVQVGRKVFNLPSVEVGSILEYRYQLRYADDHYSSPTWEIQHDYFVHKANYIFVPFKAFAPGNQEVSNGFLVDERGNAINTLIWWQRLPPGSQVKTEAPGRFVLSLTDVPPIPHEAWMPPIESVLYRVGFYYKSANNSAGFWTSEAKLWSKEVDRFADPKPLHDAVAGIVAPGDSDLDKAKKIYKAVQALDNTDFSRQKGHAEIKQLGLHAAKRAADTWSQKSGSRQDITLLYLALVRAAGLTAYDLKVVNRDSGTFDPGYMSLSQLDDDLVIVSINGKEVLLDPGEKMCPFQTIHWKHSGATGVRQSADGRAVVTTPLQSYKANTETRVADLTLDESGAIKGNLRIILSGQEALHWRQSALENDEDEVKRSFDRRLESFSPAGVELHVHHFLGMDDPGANLMAIVEAKGTVASPTSKRLILPGYFFETREEHPFVDQDKRLQPVDMHFADQITDQITLHLPSTLTVEGAPATGNIPWSDFAVLTTKTAVGANNVVIERQLSRAFTMVKAEDYTSLHDFYQKVASNDQQQLVLAVTNTGKGN